MSERSLSEQPVGERPDPSLRPSDPAGTRPKVDPQSLDLGQATFLPAPTALPPGPPPVELEPTPAKELPAAPAQAPPHTPRFQFLFGALGALGVCAIGVFVLLLSAPKAIPARPWSAWRPADNGVDPAGQIAAHVAPEYRLDNGKQIVRVTGGPPTLKGQPMTVGENRSGQQPARLEGNSVLYQLCGGGRECSIKEGKPSAQRGLLISREALELALYTFRYVGGVNQVIVTTPPTLSSPTKHALMFRPEDLGAELGHPLSYTLTTETPRVSQMERSIDAPIVKQLTGARFYDYIAEEVPQGGGAVMLLSPPTS
ncbi:MAG TPA: hypothetical protein VGY76_08495 [Solirubrobacteraceae bacterium]|nr:hypothetical protein [Solirubrobacteraceae bacterium]